MGDKQRLNKRAPTPTDAAWEEMELSAWDTFVHRTVVMDLAYDSEVYDSVIEVIGTTVLLIPSEKAMVLRLGWGAAAPLKDVDGVIDKALTSLKVDCRSIDNSTMQGKMAKLAMRMVFQTLYNNVATDNSKQVSIATNPNSGGSATALPLTDEALRRQVKKPKTQRCV